MTQTTSTTLPGDARPDTAEVVGHWIDGQATRGASTRTADVFDPATGQVARQVALADPGDVDAAVASASRAAPGWASTSLSKRTTVLFAFRELLNARAPELAAIITAEHGKVLSDAAGEVARGQEVVEFACGAPHLLKGGFTENASTGVDVHSVRQPLGVSAIISPFNFPAMVPMWFFPVAIAAGNAVILKPSEKDPSAALWIAALWKEAGLPDGVFTVLQGDAGAVNGLLDHPDVASVSFVGSTPIARHVYERASAAGKRVQALGGAKNHMVVLPDADLDAAADAATSAGYGSAGERCMAVSALVAVGDVGDALVEKIAERARALVIGDGRHGSDMGPLVTGAHRDKVAGYVAGAGADGAEVVVDGRRLAGDGSEAPAPDGADREDAGFFLGPTLLDRVPTTASAYVDEIFGPVLSVLRVDTLEDAITLVNDSPYGNGVAVFTADGSSARRFANRVSVGMIGVNVPIPVPMAYYSFGGWKNSLFGDTHAHGVEGVHFFTRGKVITSRWPEPSATATGGVDMHFPTNA